MREHAKALIGLVVVFSGIACIFVVPIPFNIVIFLLCTVIGGILTCPF